VIDGSDNFPTRYLVNDACVLLGKPIVFGAIFQHQGQVGLLNALGPKSANYRDIYPDMPSANDIPNCSETGVLGVLPGIIGTMQAAEAIKWLSGIGTPLVDRLFIYHLLDHSSYEIALVKNPSSLNSIPRNKAELENSDYVWACGDTRDITWDAAFELLRQYPDGILVDVRESHEQPKIADLPVRSMPLSVIESEKHHLRGADLVILFCQSGKRSVQAMRNLQKDFPGKRIHSLAGGIGAADSPINR
jgi:adenylyltransferase/sulfurtransferase